MDVPFLPEPLAHGASLTPAADPVALLLADKRSPATRRAYAGDLKDFFGGEPTPGEVSEFVRLPAPAIALRLATYKGRCSRAGSPRRL